MALDETQNQEDCIAWIMKNVSLYAFIIINILKIKL